MTIENALLMSIAFEAIEILLILHIKNLLNRQKG
jgi:hypothetical protein